MNRAIVITGASTGIGAAAAERLARAGYTVFAGVRSQKDAAVVKAMHERVLPLHLDVTRPDAIAGAAAEVQSAGMHLCGLVNNAGIAVAGPLEYLPMAELHKQFEVNVFGAVAVTQAFLPALRETRGRVVFVGSVQGRLTAPFLGPYSASKFALEALTDAFRMELYRSGIKVSIIEPGAVRTPIWKKGRERKDALVAMLPARALEHYGAAVEAVARVAQTEERDGMPVSTVAAIIETALTSRRPKARYVVGMPARIQTYMALLPEPVRDALLRKVMGLS